MPERKIAILIGDGMADFAIESLGGKTPLEAARTPFMDRLAREGVLGMVRTVPEGMPPGSDTANLAIFGYDPAEIYTGRAPLEAINMGIEMGPQDVAFRCNLVNIDDENIMVDFSAGHVETAFAALVIGELAREIRADGIEFFPGVSYRHIMMWRNFPFGEMPLTTPPHDIQGRGIGDYLPHGKGAMRLMEIMDRSRLIIKDSKLIADNRVNYKGEPSAAWLWGAGKKPSLIPLRERYGLEGYTISAVDLINGIGRAAGLSPLRVEGATGYIDTNYRGKADALIGALKDVSFVFLHVESPDESGHEGNLEHKLRAIEDFDRDVVGRVMEGLDELDDFTLLVMPDHPTPVSLRTHTGDPVPFCIYRKKGFAGNAFRGGDVKGYSEAEAARTGVFVGDGHRLMDILINEKF